MPGLRHPRQILFKLLNKLTSIFPYIHKSSLIIRGEQGILQSPAILKANATQAAGNHVYGKKFASAFGGDKSLYRFACLRVLSREVCVAGQGWV
jgi:hypothetical protein